MKALASVKAQPALSLLVLSFVLLLGVIINQASVMEDAYITFRVVDNAVNGFGLRWNLHERVQPYTNPLWMFLHIPFYAVYGNIVFDTLMISLVCTEIALFMVLLTHQKPHLYTVFWFLLPLALSRAFTVYSTSGFENPLEHLLFAVFGWFLWRGKPEKIWLYGSLCIALSMVNRLDTLIFYAPVCAYLYHTRKAQIKWKQVAAGFSPIIAWELFSLFYYGFLFPNTKYAKLNTGIPQSEYLELGLSYLLNLFTVDFVSGFMMVAAICCIPFLYQRYQKDKDDKAGLLLSVAAGIALYVLYVVYVGGTYLSSRMFSLNVFASAWVLLALAGNTVRLKNQAIVLASLVAITLFAPPMPWLKAQCKACFHGVDDIHAEVKDGLWEFISGKKTVPEPESIEHIQPVVLEWSMGKWGYGLARGIKVVDGFALVDPLLARLPMNAKHIMTMGMTSRDVPAGYMEAVETGSTHGMDPDLAKYYKKLRIVIADDLWSRERLKEVFKFNLGAYDYLVAQYNQRHPVK